MHAHAVAHARTLARRRIVCPHVGLADARVRVSTRFYFRGPINGGRARTLARFVRRRSADDWALMA